MRVVLFCHSLLSDWNHGNAHFLRGVVSELVARGHEVRVFEPQGRVERAEPRRRPRRGGARRRAPRVSRPSSPSATTRARSTSTRRSPAPISCWCTSGTSRSSCAAHRRAPRARRRRLPLLFHDTHHRSATDPARDAPLRPPRYDGVLAFGGVVRDLYLQRGWARRAFVWHEAADTAPVRAPPRRARRARPRVDRQLGRRASAARSSRSSCSARCASSALAPRVLRRPLSRGGARRPSRARASRYRRLAPEPPRRRRLRARAASPCTSRGGRTRSALPGSRRSAPSRRSPAASRSCSAPWERRGGALRARARLPGRARRRRDDAAPRWALRTDRRRPLPWPRGACATVLARHTCAHRVDELLADRRRARPRCAGSGATPRSRIAFFGSSLVSAYWNGAATYYRGILRALHARGHRITFYEPDAYDRQEHRDIDDPPWARVVVYAGSDPAAAHRALDAARGADVVVKASGVGVFDALLEAGVASLGGGPDARSSSGTSTRPRPSTGCARDPPIRCRALLPRYDLVLTYGGGDPVVRGYLGARRAALRAHLQRARSRRPTSRRRPSRASRPTSRSSPTACPTARRASTSSSCEPARALPSATLPARRQRLAGQGAASERARVGHVYTRRSQRVQLERPRGAQRGARQHGRVRASRPRRGSSRPRAPAACIVTDAWEGIELVPRARTRDPGRRERATRWPSSLGALTPERARAIGQAARRRVLAAPHLRGARRRGRGGAPRRGRRERGGRRMSRARTSSWASRSRPRGATGTRRPTARSSRRSARAGTACSSWSAIAPYYAANRDLAGARPTAAPSSTGASTISGRASARPCATPTWWCVGIVRARGRARRRAGCWRRARGSARFYDIDTPVTLAKLERGEHAYVSRGARPALRPLPLVHRRADARTAGAPLRRAAGAAPLLLGRPGRATAPSRRRSALGPRLPRDVQRRSPARARRAARRARAPLPRGQLRASPARSTRTGLAWPANVERREHVAAGRAPRLLQRAALHPQRDAEGHGGGGPLAERAPVRGGGLRRPRDQRRVARARGVLRAGPRDPRRPAPPRRCWRCCASCPRRERRALGRRARARALGAHTAAPPRRGARALRATSASPSGARGSDIRDPSRRRRPEEHDVMMPHPGHRRRGLPRLPPVRAPAPATGTRSSRSTTSPPARATNVAHLARAPALPLADARRARSPYDLAVDRIYNLASPASPPALPARSGADHAHQRARRLPRAGARRRRSGARVFQASTSEVYGDPEVHPQPESYRGAVNPIGIRACYDEGKRCAESLMMDYARAARGRGAHRAHLQHLRSADGAGRRAGGVELHRPGAPRRGPDRVRRRLADAELLLRGRPRGGPRAADGAPGGAGPGEPRQPGRVHGAPAGRAGARA